MTRIDFYILQSNTSDALFDFCCRLIEKAVRQGNKVMIGTETQADSEHLDALLWRFKPESYIPHAVNNDTETDAHQGLPVMISHGPFPQQQSDVLVNLRQNIPDDFARFTRFAQVVNQAPVRLASSRRHFAFFKDRGYPIEVNKLNR